MVLVGSAVNAGQESRQEAKEDGSNPIMTSFYKRGGQVSLGSLPLT